MCVQLMCFSEGVMLVMHQLLSTRTIFETFSTGNFVVVVTVTNANIDVKR